jgi:hypothetical protein
MINFSSIVYHKIIGEDIPNSHELQNDIKVELPRQSEPEIVSPPSKK